MIIWMPKGKENDTRLMSKTNQIVTFRHDVLKIVIRVWLSESNMNSDKHHNEKLINPLLSGKVASLSRKWKCWHHCNSLRMRLVEWSGVE